MSTVAAGTPAALVFDFAGGDITGAEITIEPAAGGAPVLGPTSAGIGAAGGGRYTYVWSVPVDQADGLYTATVTGVDGVPVEQAVTVAVTNLPVYVSLADYKADRRVTKDTSDALYLARIRTASRAIDKRTGERRFWLDTTASTRSYRLRGRVTRDGLLLVDDIGDDTDLVVEVGSGSSWSEVTDYEISPDNALTRRKAITGLERVGGWPASPGALVRVTARWGWPEIPDDITEATTLLASRLLLRRDSPEGVAASGEWGALRVSRWDPDVEALIEPYKLTGIG